MLLLVTDFDTTYTSFDTRVAFSATNRYSILLIGPTTSTSNNTIITNTTLDTRC